MIRHLHFKAVYSVSKTQASMSSADVRVYVERLLNFSLSQRNTLSVEFLIIISRAYVSAAVGSVMIPPESIQKDEKNNMSGCMPDRALYVSSLAKTGEFLCANPPEQYVCMP